MSAWKKTAAGILLSACLMTGCGMPAAETMNEVEPIPSDKVEIIEEEVPLDNIPAVAHVLTPEASGKSVYESGSAALDYSNAAKGYVMVKYGGSNQKIKVRVAKKNATTYTYDLNARSQYEVFPLTEGNGTYTVAVFENISGSSYAQVMAEEVEVSLENEFIPFLTPNQFVSFTDGSQAVKKGAELAKNAKDDVEIVERVYDFVVKNISYDTQKAQNVQSGYLPDVDAVLNSKMGICFDYAALMAAMLRSQEIPTKLVVGYTGEIYHAWISVYLDKQGWVDNLIYFDGNSWKLMDPTFASSGKGDSSVQKYIGDASNYTAKYTY